MVYQLIRGGIRNIEPCDPLCRVRRMWAVWKNWLDRPGYGLRHVDELTHFWSLFWSEWRTRQSPFRPTYASESLVLAVVFSCSQAFPGLFRHALYHFELRTSWACPEVSVHECCCFTYAIGCLAFIIRSFLALINMEDPPNWLKDAIDKIETFEYNNLAAEHL